jgi:hypothetical protein
VVVRELSRLKDTRFEGGRVASNLDSFGRRSHHVRPRAGDPRAPFDAAVFCPSRCRGYWSRRLSSWPSTRRRTPTSSRGTSYSHPGRLATGSSRPFSRRPGVGHPTSRPCSIGGRPNADESLQSGTARFDRIDRPRREVKRRRDTPARLSPSARERLSRF